MQWRSGYLYRSKDYIPFHLTVTDVMVWPIFYYEIRFSF